MTIDWEQLARHQGALTVLDPEGHEIPTADYLATGETDLTALLTASAQILGHEIPLATALDFGCGVGRLTLPLARRATTVTACDLAPTMLTHARHNAEQAGLHNITYLTTDTLPTLPDGTFTFICSLLVFQYIPRRTGYETIRTLMRLLAPNGIALLHVMLAPSGEALRRYARFSRRSSTAPTRPAAISTPLYEYDERTVLREIQTADARIAARFDAPVGEKSGAVYLVEKGNGAGAKQGARIGATKGRRR